MAFNNKYSTKPASRSRYQEDEYEERQERRPAKQQAYGNKKGFQKQAPRTQYIPILSVFANDKANGLITMNIKAQSEYGDRPSTQQVLTREQWLAYCNAVYDGEAAFRISIFPSESQTADYTGSLNMTEEKYNELIEEVPAVKAKSAKRRPEPEVIEDEDEDEEYEEVVRKPVKKQPAAPVKQQTKVQQVKKPVKPQPYEELLLEDDTEDDDEEEYVPAKKPAAKPVAAAKPKAKPAFIEVDEDEDDEPPARPAKSAKKAKAQPEETEEAEEPIKEVWTADDEDEFESFF